MTFAGWRSGESLLETYAATDIFVLLSRREPWGIVVNEAAACGLPLVLTDTVGAAADLLVPGENGELVQSGDLDGQALRSHAWPKTTRCARATGALARARGAVGLRAERRELRRGDAPRYGRAVIAKNHPSRGPVISARRHATRRSYGVTTRRTSIDEKCSNRVRISASV